MLVVTNLQGQSEFLTDYKDLARKQRVNGERSLSFLLLKTERNAHAFDLVQEESIIEYDGHKYRIKQLEERTIGSTPIKQVQADHVFFDIIDVYQYGTISGTKTISEALSFALNGTGYIFVVVDAFDTVPLENFGDDNAAALFQKILELYGAEFDLVGNEVRLYKQIGSNTDFQFRYKHNIKTLSKTIKTDNLSTYIKGFGKQNDDGTYAATAEYTSPMADIYGIRHAKPVYDERFTNNESLLEYIKSKLQDTPEISITIEFVDLAKAGYPLPRPRLGDTVYLIYEPLNIDITTRILEITDYPESNRSPEVTLANFKESFTDVSMRYTKSQIEKIYNEQTGRIRYNVLDEAVKRATEALTNSLTQLEYPPNLGIVARDPNNPDRFTVLRSAGLGITTNGGVTFENAVTPDGINTNLLTAGQIKTNNIQIIGTDNLFYWDGNYLIAIDALNPNKFVRLNSGGLYVAKGAITVERSDGYKLIIDGKANFELSVQGGTPQYIDERKNDDGTHVVQIDGPYAKTASTEYVRFDYFRFIHTARYLNLAFYAKGGGAGAYAYVQIQDDQGNVLATQLTNDTVDTNIGITIDLGVPTGQPKLFYAYFKTTSANNPARVRLATKYLMG